MKRSPDLIWQFIGCGSLVAFIVVTVLWWNQRVYISNQGSMIDGLLSNQNLAKRTIDACSAENDSLYKANDSLKRAQVIERSFGPIIVGGDQSNVIRDNSGSVNVTIGGGKKEIK